MYAAEELANPRSARGIRRDGITEPDVDLRLAACPGNFAGNQHSRTGVPGILTDLLDTDRCRIEDDAVLNLDAGNVTE